MNYSSETYGWINDVLLIIGILLIPVGLGFMFLSEKVFYFANRTNKWVSTENLFNKINKPRYKEAFFYRHHRLFGLCITFFSVISLYFLTFYMGVDSILDILIKLSTSEFEKWLFVILYYLLLAAISLAILFGLIMFIRPSSIKSFEKLSNHWVDTEGALKKLDKQNHLPDKILPGKNPKIFGFFIILASIYIIWRTI